MMNTLPNPTILARSYYLSRLALDMHGPDKMREAIKSPEQLAALLRDALVLLNTSETVALEDPLEKQMLDELHRAEPPDEPPEEIQHYRFKEAVELIGYKQPRSLDKLIKAFAKVSPENAAMLRDWESYGKIDDSGITALLNFKAERNYAARASGGGSHFEEEPAVGEDPSNNISQ